MGEKEETEAKRAFHLTMKSALVNNALVTTHCGSSFSCFVTPRWLPSYACPWFSSPFVNSYTKTGYKEPTSTHHSGLYAAHQVAPELFVFPPNRAHVLLLRVYQSGFNAPDQVPQDSTDAVCGNLLLPKRALLSHLRVNNSPRSSRHRIPRKPNHTPEAVMLSFATITRRT